MGTGPLEKKINGIRDELAELIELVELRRKGERRASTLHWLNDGAIALDMASDWCADIDRAESESARRGSKRAAAMIRAAAMTLVVLLTSCALPVVSPGRVYECSGVFHCNAGINPYTGHECAASSASAAEAFTVDAPEAVRAAYPELADRCYARFELTDAACVRTDEECIQ